MPEEPEREAAAEIPVNYMLWIALGVAVVLVVAGVAWMLYTGHSPQSLLCGIIYRIPGLSIAVSRGAGGCA